MAGLEIMGLFVCLFVSGQLAKRQKCSPVGDDSSGDIDKMVWFEATLPPPPFLT